MTPYQEHAQALFKCFESLTAYTRQQLFASARRATPQPLPAKWPQQVLKFLLRSPELDYEAGSEWIPFALMFWPIIVMQWGNTAWQILGLSPLAVSRPTTTATTTASLWLALPVIVFVLLLLLAALAAIFSSYWGWVDFWRDCRYSPNYRVGYTLLCTVFVIGLTIGGLPPLMPQALRDNLWQDRAVTIKVVSVYLLLLVPAITVTYRLTVGFVLWFVKGVLVGLLRYIVGMHHPLPARILHKLSLEPIPLNTTPDDKLPEPTWQLADLSPEDLEFLREWAQANREATEKRLLPTTVLFGAVGLFADTDAFNNAVQGALKFLELIFTTDIWWLNMTIPFIFIWVTVFVISMLRLIENVIVQSLIIEACMVAAHAQRTTNPPNPATQATPVKKCWFRWL